MAENICLMFTNGDTSSYLIKVLSLAVAAVDLHKRTILYVEGFGVNIAVPGGLELYDRSDKALIQQTAGTSLVDMRSHFLNAGGELWVSPFITRQLDPSNWEFIPGAIAVDERTLLTFLLQDTLVINY